MFACAGAIAAEPPRDESGKPASADAVQTLGAECVTGPRIRGADLETEHASQVLKRGDLLHTGLPGVADIVQSLVVAANGQTLNRDVNNSVHAVGTGALRVNLRSLDANRTPVQVNGQRFVSAVDGAVDPSAVPLSLVERVGAIKDGASAIHGSGAVGGVINIIMHKDFTGIRFGLYAGETDHVDGFSRHVDFGFGGGGDKWNASFGLEYGKDDPVMAGTRRISPVPAPGAPCGVVETSASQYGIFYLPDGGPHFVLVPGRPGTSPDDFRRRSLRTDNDCDFIPYNYLQTPQERKPGFGQFQWVISPVL